MIASGAVLTRSRRQWLIVLSLAAVVTAAPATAVSQELPRVFLDTTYSPPPVPPGQIVPVASGGNLQTAIDNAQLGDIIELQAGATFTGNFTLPNKTTGSGWIYIRTSAHASLPSPGTRVTPSQAGLMAKIQTNNTVAAIRTFASAHHYRFVGIEVTATGPITNLIHLEATDTSGNSVQNSLTEVPTDIVFDRCYIHGHATSKARRGVAMNSARTAVVDSYVSNFHEVGADSQALGGWNGPGPFKIVNNYLEGAGENVLFGGSDPAIAGLVSEDIEIRRNHMFKPLTWKQNDPSYAGIAWSVKNLFELKNARRVLIEGNILENNWVHAQTGKAVLFTVRNQSGGCPQCTVEDVTFQKNIVRHSTSGISISGTDDLQASQQSARFLIRDNLLYDIDPVRWGSTGGCCNRDFIFLNIDSPDPARAGGIRNLIVDHNTTRVSGSASGISNFGDSTAADDKHVSPIFRNNLFQRGTYGMFTSAGEGTAGLNAYTTNWTFQKNVIIGGSSGVYPTQSCSPASTCYPVDSNAVGFVDWANDDYRLCETGTPGCSAPSPYNNAGTDGKDIGADMDALLTATAGAISGSWGGGGGQQTPFNGAPFSVPGTFEAEHFDLGGENVAYHDAVPGNAGGAFRATEDVDIILATGNATGYVVNNIQTGEWVEYTISAAAAAAYTIELKVSSQYPASRFHLEIDGTNVSGSVVVPNTGWWGTFQWVMFSGVTLSAGQHVLRIHSDEEYFNLDAVRITRQAPFTGTPAAVPGTFQAENFDLGGEGEAYHDVVPGNAGGLYRTTEDVDIILPSGNNTGHVVNNFQTGEWMEYAIGVATAGTYAIQLKLSTTYTTSRFHVEVDGVDVSGSILVPSTGAWNTFQLVASGNVTLTAGHHVVRIVAEQEYFNLDAIQIQ